MTVCTRCTGVARRGRAELEGLVVIVEIAAIAGLLIWLCIWGYHKANEPPIQTSFRESLLYTNGKVLQVRNTGKASLGCCVVMENVRGDQKKLYSFTVAPGKSEEIGVLECGWNFERNESVSLYTDGYTTLSFTVP